MYKGLLIVLGMLVNAGGPLYAADSADQAESMLSEDAFDKMFLSSGISDENISDKENAWKNFGFIESVNQFNVPVNNNRSSTNTIKTETRLRLNTEYERDSILWHLSLDAYLLLNELREERRESVIDTDLQELFFQKQLGRWQLKAGKQLFSWGTGDVFHVTNYFDQLDLRQLFVIDDDDRYRGVYAFSAKYVYKDFAVEMVYTPFFSPVLMPEEDSFWAIELQNFQSLDFQFQTDNDIQRDSSFALRAGGVAGNIDYHVSLFSGISNTLVFLPVLNGSASYLSGNDISNFTALPNQLGFDTQLFYDRIETIGFNLASSIGRFSYRFEAAYTPDMFALILPDAEDIAAQIVRAGLDSLPLTSGEIFNIQSDFVERETAPFFSWVFGIDYNYRGAYGLVLLEWTRARYLQDRHRFINPIFDDVLLLRWEDRFIDDHLQIEAGILSSPVNGDPGYAFTYEVGWDFMNGWKVMTGGFFFNGNDEEILFELVDQRDMVFFDVKFEF